MTTAITESVNTPIEQTRWRVDPDRSSVEFEVATLWGLVTVAGRFESYDGTLALTRTPAIELTIDADSLDTNHAVRDEHLRSTEFFDVENHPYVRFVFDSATLSGQRLKASGRLHAAGRNMPLKLEGSLRRAGDELEVDVVTFADHRQLGMPTWSPLGMLRTTSKLTVRGRLVSGPDLD